MGAPRLSRFGSDGVEAIAVLSMHADMITLGQVTAAFEQLAKDDPADMEQSLLPALVDYRALRRHEAQTYGSIWLFDETRQPFLVQTADVSTVNARRASCGLPNLAWPRSLAVPPEEQPWLQRPISKRQMRWPTAQELDDLELVRSGIQPSLAKGA